MQHLHFLGICGTAMGAVASAMAQRGYTVTGSDSCVYPPMSTFLESEGICLVEGYKASNIPEGADLIIVGNAISRGNEELEAVLERGLRYKSLPEAMKEFFLWGKHNYVVTGTHGKTTTTSMLAWVLEDNNLNPSFMIGGIARNLGRGGRFTESNYCVMEGDEYDTAFFDKRSKFLHYLPECVIMNNIEMDHADIYSNVEEIKLSFERLLRIVPRNGIVYYNADCAHCVDVASRAPHTVKMVSVGFGEQADLIISDVDYAPTGSSFTLQGSRYTVPMVGDFNVRNAAMAACAALFAGLKSEQVAASLLSFEGVARRQELRGEVRGIKVIDDFAHHPTAIRLAVTGLRQRYPDSRLWVIFEPRSNTTRRRLFQTELAESLATADVAVVAPVENPGKLEPGDRLDVARLQAEISADGTVCYMGANVDDIIQYAASKAQEGDVLLVMSNGGFENIHTRLLAALKNK